MSKGNQEPVGVAKLGHGLLVVPSGHVELSLTKEERQLISSFRAMSADAKCDLICMSEAIARSTPAAPVRLSIAGR
jgi:hypothetical protein